MGHCKINILNSISDNETSDFIDTMFAPSFYPTINISTQITVTSKRLVDNILFTIFTKNTLVCNIATTTSDHLTQFLITTTENKSFLEKEQIDLRSYRN